MPRNPILAKSFRAVKLAENAGFGFDKMMNGWKSYKGIEPVFDIHIDSTIVTFPLQINDAPETEDEKGGAKGGAEGGAKGGIKGGEVHLTKRQKEVIEFIKNNSSIAYRDVAEKMEINASAAQKHFNVLKKKGTIQRIGGTSGYWKILID